MLICFRVGTKKGEEGEFGVGGREDGGFGDDREGIEERGRGGVNSSPPLRNVTFSLCTCFMKLTIILD